MPQTIAMQPLLTAAAAPTATLALASGRGVSGKAPVFAGLLAQLGPMASPSAPTSGLSAVAGETKPPASAGQQSAQPQSLAMRQAEATPSTPSAGGQAVARETASSADAGQQPAQPELAAAIAADRTPPVPEPTPPALPQPAPSVPASGQPVRPRSAVAAHSKTAGESAATAPASGSDVAATPTPPPTLASAVPAPTSAADPPQPRYKPGGASADAPRLDGVAAKPGQPAPGSPQSGAPPAQPDTTGATSDQQADPAWPAAPAAPAIAQVGGPLVQPALASTQPVQIAGPARLPDQIGAASASLQDATTTAPAQQVSAALVSLVRAPDGGQRMTLRLEPAELGQVEIRIDRPQDAPAQVDITVQRPETLTLLLRDQPQLQRALDQAGVPADGRSLNLHLAAPESASSPGSATSGAAGGADPGQGGGNGAGPKSGGQGQSADTPDADQDDAAASLPGWLRVGLDITA